MVCTSEGSGDDIEDGVYGYLFDFKNAHELVEEVNYLFQHRGISLKFGGYNRQKIESANSISNVTAQMMEFYKMV